MPRLLAFLPCQNIIREEGTNNLSIISMFTKLTAHLPTPEDLATVGMLWHILVVWYRDRDEDDSETKYRQACTIEAPNGTALLTLSNEFAMSTDLVNTIFSVQGFPLAPGGGGRYMLRLSVGKSGKELTEIAVYPLMISFERIAEPGS